MCVCMLCQCFSVFSCKVCVCVLSANSFFFFLFCRHHRRLVCLLWAPSESTRWLIHFFPLSVFLSLSLCSCPTNGVFTDRQTQTDIGKLVGGAVCCQHLLATATEATITPTKREWENETCCRRILSANCCCCCCLKTVTNCLCDFYCVVYRADVVQTDFQKRRNKKVPGAGQSCDALMEKRWQALVWLLCTVWFCGLQIYCHEQGTYCTEMIFFSQIWVGFMLYGVAATVVLKQCSILRTSYHTKCVSGVSVWSAEQL